MADVLYNVHKNRLYEAWLNGKTLGMLLLKSTAPEASNPDLDTVADLLAVSGVDECDFTNYERKTLSNLSSTEDDTGDEATVDADNVTFTNAGGAVNNTPVAAVIYEEGASDAARYLVGYYDTGFGTTATNGGDFTVNIANFITAK